MATKPPPTVIPEIAIACLQGYITTDPGVVDPEPLLRGVCLLVVRDVIIGKHNDSFHLVKDGLVLSAQWGNSDPGRFGWRDAIKKYYPRAQEGLIGGMIPGHHNGVEGRMRQATAKQAEACGMTAAFKKGDTRGKGLFTVERMKDADTIAKIEVGMFNINWHPAPNDEKTGSAGCLTNPPKIYDGLRDIVYESKQPWLPIVITRGPI